MLKSTVSHWYIAEKYQLIDFGRSTVRAGLLEPWSSEAWVLARVNETENLSLLGTTQCAKMATHETSYHYSSLIMNNGLGVKSTTQGVYESLIELCLYIAGNFGCVDGPSLSTRSIIVLLRTLVLTS